MRRVIGLLLTCFLMLACLGALAQEGEFTFDAQTGTIKAWTGSAADLVVPAAIGGVPVKAIGAGAFSQNTALKSVSLPEGLTHLLYNAFYFCDQLETVTFPATLQAIDSYAFFSCKNIKNLVFPANLAAIDNDAFAFCEGLVSVQFQGKAPFIGRNAFGGGPQGRQYTVPAEEQAAYEALLGQACLPGSLGHVTAASPIFEVDAATGTLTGYKGQDAAVNIPGEVNGIALTAIGDRAFYANPWVRVIRIPEGIASIGQEAFFATQLGQVYLPLSLVTIGKSAFGGAPLESLRLPAGLREIGVSAFNNAQLDEIALPEGITVIPERAFERCWSLATAYLPASLTEIGPAAFLDNTALSFVVFSGNTPPTLAPDAFLDCKNLVDIDIGHTADKAQVALFEQALAQAGLNQDAFKVWRAYHPDAPPFPSGAKMTFDEASQLVTGYQDNLVELSMYFNFWKADGSGTLSILGVGDGVFENSTLETFFVPRSDEFTTIGSRAFKNSKLRFIDLFDSVTTIGEEAFAGCASLEGITIPDSVRTIGANAFLNCDSLQQLVLPAGVQVAGNLGLPADRIRVSADASAEAITALKAAMGFTWDQDLLRVGETPVKVSMPEGLAESPEADFEFDAATGTVTRYIGQDSKVVVPRAIGGVPVTGIGFTAFSNLTVYTALTGGGDNVGLTEVILPDTVRLIGDSAFLNCKALRRVESYGPIDALGIRAFENCEALEAVHFHNGIREMGIYAFNLCGSLREITLGQKLAAIPEGAFVGCGFEGTLTLSAPAIGNLAFQNNAKVTTLHILGTVTDIGEAAFRGMGALQAVYFGRADAGILGEFRYQFDDTAKALKVYLPEDSSDEAVAAFVQKMKQNMLPGEGMVQRLNIPAQSGTVVVNQPASETPAQEAGAQAQPAPAQGTPLGRYVCVQASSGGIAIDLATIGTYAVVFSADQTAVLTVGGTDFPPMPMAVDEGIITLDYFGQKYVFKPLPDGGYELDFMGAMLLTFQKE